MTTACLQLLVWFTGYLCLPACSHLPPCIAKLFIDCVTIKIISSISARTICTASKLILVLGGFYFVLFLFVCLFFTPGPCEVPGLAASGSTGKLLEIQNLGLCPKPTSSQDSRGFLRKEHTQRRAVLTLCTDVAM